MAVVDGQKGAPPLAVVDGPPLAVILVDGRDGAPPPAAVDGQNGAPPPAVDGPLPALGVVPAVHDPHDPRVP